MIKEVYILTENTNHMYPDIIGAVSDKHIADKFIKHRAFRRFETVKVDDPELLNRIAKENHKNEINT